MQVRKPESFVRGAMVLTVAALISRLLGAFYKPIIAWIFAPYDGHNGAAGIGLTQVPLSAYQVVLSFTSVGLNVGISRMVAERLALGDTHGAKRVFRFSLSLMTGLGLVSAVLMWVGAPWIAGLISSDVLETIPGFRATAPALLFTSILAAYRGLFQGFQQMSPNAYSQIIEQVVRVGAGMLLTFMLVRTSVPLGAAGFNFGDVVGALAALVYMLVLVRRGGRHLWADSLEAAADHDEPVVRPEPLPSGWRLARRIFAVAGPITIVGAVVPLMMLADTFFVFRSLAQAGIREAAAQAQYGLLTNVFMIVNLPAVFTTAIYTSILPAVTHAMALGKVDQARKRAKQAYRMTLLLAIPAQAGLYALATGLYALIYRDPVGGQVMAAISWATVPIMLQQTTSGILQGIGRIGLPVQNFVIGALVKVGLTALWTPSMGIDGAAYATACGFTVAAVLNLVQVERLLGRTLRTRAMIIKPLSAALVMVLVIRLLQPYVGTGDLATLLLVGAGGLVYGVVLLLVGGLRRRDVEGLPKVGRPLAALLARTRLLR